MLGVPCVMLDWMEYHFYYLGILLTASLAMQSIFIIVIIYLTMLTIMCRYKAHPCVRCGEGIISTGCKKETLITCNGQSFHQQCYTCQVDMIALANTISPSYQDCDTNLVGEFVCCHNNDIICFLCDSKKRK